MENINYEEELTNIINQKNIANGLLKEGKFSESYSIYFELKEFIERLKEKNSDAENEKFREIMNQYKFIQSNLAMVCHKQKKFKESVKFDRRVIALDKLFHKSYARLIDSYMNSDNFTLARYFYSLMRNVFPDETLKLYKDIVKRVEKEIEEKDAFVNSLKSIFSTK
jgi:hypothetical protein